MTRWNQLLVSQCSKESQLSTLTNSDDLVDYQQDFGRMSITNNLAVAKPKTWQQLSSLLRFANDRSLPVTIRSKGLSQSGQSVPIEGGLSIDVTQFNQVQQLANDSITADCCVNWRDLIAESLLKNKIPYVYPYNTYLNLGGLLSAGGLGSATINHGIAASHVESMRVMVANGETVNCQKGDDLFDAALSGLGQFGVICDVSLRLRDCGKSVRSYYLLYDEHQSWLNDQFSLVGKVDYLEAYTTPVMLGLKNTEKRRIPLADWFFCIHVAIEYDGKVDDKVLSDLNFFRLCHQEDNTLYDYVTRHDNRFKAMQLSGQWQLAHPWFECYVPRRFLEKMLPEILDKVSLGFGGMYHIFPVKPVVPNYFMLPDSEEILAFNILTPGVLPYQLEECMESSNWLNQLFLSNGGKRYVSGWLGQKIDETFWENHYGDKYQQRKAIKQKYDPNGIFCSSLMY